MFETLLPSMLCRPFLTVWEQKLRSMASLSVQSTTRSSTLQPRRPPPPLSLSPPTPCGHVSNYTPLHKNMQKTKQHDQMQVFLHTCEKICQNRAYLLTYFTLTVLYLSTVTYKWNGSQSHHRAEQLQPCSLSNGQWWDLKYLWLGIFSQLN